MNNVRFADDALLVADSETKLKELLETVVGASKQKGLSINKHKKDAVYGRQQKEIHSLMCHSHRE